MRHPRLPLLVCLLVAVAGLARFADLDYAVDDAWISFRVARNLWTSGVLSFNVEGPPVEGMTNLSWTLLSALWVRLPVDPILPARALGGALHLLTVGLVTTLAGRVAGPRAALVAGLLAATSGSLAYYALSGLETPLTTALFMIALERLERGAPTQAGVALAALAMTRPEGVLVGSLLVGLVTLEGRRAGLRAGLPFFVGVAALELGRLAYYGALVPNTFYAKAPEVGGGLDYAVRVCTLGLGLVGPLVLWPLRQDRRALGLGALAAVGVLGAVASGGDWMPGLRRVALELLLLYLLAGVAVARPAGRAFAGLGVLALFGGSLLGALRGDDSARFADVGLRRLGEAAAATPGLSRVAMVDIGRFGWVFPGHIVDLVGLTDAHLAHLPGGHANKPWDEAWFRGQAADLLIVRSESPVGDPLLAPPRLGAPEVGLVRSVLENGGYRLHSVTEAAPGRWLLIFRRDGLVLPPGLWGGEVEKDLRQLFIEAKARSAG